MSSTPTSLVPLDQRSLWFVGTVGLSIIGIAAALMLAPSFPTSSTRGLDWLLFIGSSVHVASTGWFYADPATRRYMLSRPTRYVIAPALLIIGAVVGAAAIPRPSVDFLQ